MITTPARINAETRDPTSRGWQVLARGARIQFSSRRLNEALHKIQDRTEQFAKWYCATDRRVPLGGFRDVVTPDVAELIRIVTERQDVLSE